MTGDATQPSSAARPPPRVIGVPSPKVSPLSSRQAIMLVVLVFQTLLLLLVWQGPAARAAGVVFAAISVGLVYFSFRRSISRNRRIADFRARHEDWLRDPVAAALDRHWFFASLPPPVEKAETVYQRCCPTPADGAVIISLAMLELPPVGDYRLQPEVIAVDRVRQYGSPRAMLLAVLIGMPFLIGFIWVLQREGVTPETVVLGTIIVVVGTVWFVQNVVQGQYLRVAPGMVQVLRYSTPTSRPRIRSYPLTAGTFVVLRQRGEDFDLTLSRDSNRETIPLGRFKPEDERWRRVWHALLSTAPTPPLSDEGLVG